MLFQSKSAKLFGAIREGREDHVRDLLLSGGINLSERDPQGRTALVLAAEQGRAAAVKLLLAAGAEANEPAAAGETPLIAAANEGSTQVIELLLASGARVNDSDSSGATALHAATVRATRLASLGIVDSVQKLLPLLDAGANVNAADKMDNSADGLDAKRRRCDRGDKPIPCCSFCSNAAPRLITRVAMGAPPFSPPLSAV